MKMYVFWDVASFSLVDIDRREQAHTAPIIRAMTFESANVT
jgi:hypothetical protein